MFDNVKYVPSSKVYNYLFKGNTACRFEVCIFLVIPGKCFHKS